jgi:hypothetical protein
MYPVGTYRARKYDIMLRIEFIPQNLWGNNRGIKYLRTNI